MNILLPVLTAIGTGIGTLGFVIFFGGFILWARFKATGLPANEAVAQVPRNDLVVTGASFLVPALLGALVAVAVAFAARDMVIGEKRRRTKRSKEAELILASSDMDRLRAKHDRVKRKIEALEARIKRYREDEERLGIDSPERTQIRLAGDMAERERDSLEKSREELEEEQIPSVEKKWAELTKPNPTTRRLNPKERALQFAIGGIPMLAAEVFVISLGWSGLSYRYQVALALVVVLTIVTAVIVLNKTEHFSWFALCVFLGVGLTIAASTYARTQSHPRISPIAALVGSTPVTGFFVAETSDAVYFGVPKRFQRLSRGEISFNHHGTTLVRTPKSLVSGLTIGPLMDEAHAYRRSIVLALALCHQVEISAAPNKDEGGGATATPKAKPGCSPRSTDRLHQRLLAAKPRF